jgi:hypothetical protein
MRDSNRSPLRSARSLSAGSGPSAVSEELADDESPTWSQHSRELAQRSLLVGNLAEDGYE